MMRYKPVGIKVVGTGKDMGYHKRSRVESKMFVFKHLRQGVASHFFNCQVIDLYMRVNMMTRFTQFGTSETITLA